MSVLSGDSLRLAALAFLLLWWASRRVSRIFEKQYPALGKKVPVSGPAVLHVIDRAPDDPSAAPELPIVVIHGASGNARDGEAALGTRLGAKARILFFDRPGHGWSERPPGRSASAPDGQARMIVEALDQLDVGQAVIVGHSLGAAVACAVALIDKKRVAGLVVITPATHPWPGGGGISWHNRIAALPVIGRVFSELFPPLLGALVMPLVLPSIFTPNPVPDRYELRSGAALALRPKAFRANALDVVGLKANVTRLSPQYCEITAPTLIVCGGADVIVSNALHAERLAGEIKGSRLVELAGIGHMPQWTAGDEVARLILEFTAVLPVPPVMPAQAPAPPP